MATWRLPTACSSAGYVANRLAGSRAFNSAGRTVVPLLHPQQHGLPFLLTLELHAAPPAGAAPPPPPSSLDRSLYALHYVLAGSGHLVRPAGGSEELQAGDSVLMHSGAAACHAAASSAAAASAGAGLPLDSPWQLAELVAYMPRQLFEEQQQQQQLGKQQRQQQQQQDGPAQQELAWAQMLQSAGLRPLLQQPGGSGSSSDGTEEAEQAQMTAEFVGALLAGARDTARQLLLQQGGDSSSVDSDSGGESSGGGSTRPAAHGSRASLLPPVVRAATNRLVAWWTAQQQCTCPVTKRTLAELTAFRLPNQTNRLAVQFDPFSRPQVPFISGIEVFERGHRTTPHVHPQAHELFFILAGEGTGFCGNQRFPVTAGDVVVFRPGAVHGIDNGDSSRMYCLELMLPNEAFAEMVRAGEDVGHLSGDDLCVLAAIGCR